MANSAEKLFQTVLSRLPPPVSEPDGYLTEEDEQSIGSVQPDEGDHIFSVDEDEAAADFIDAEARSRDSRILDASDMEAFEGGIRHRGFEALAFYKSRRIVNQDPFPGQWGIFYLKQGLIYVESLIARFYPGYGRPRKLALNFLREHERFHFRADLQTLMFEATLGRHLWSPTRRLLRGQCSDFVEEALANRQVWDWSKKAGVRIEEFASEFMLLQPGAYARFEEPRLSLAAEWAGVVVDQKPLRAVQRPDLAHWIEATPVSLSKPSLCPEFVIYPSKLHTWLPRALVLPPVEKVEDGSAVSKALAGRLSHLSERWAATKAKLIENRLLHGLNLKPWRKHGRDHYSVRVNENFRAHLQHLGGGRWIAYDLGPHTQLGHD
ncbi:MAG: hypothetical protein J0L58_07630 [Burkholderiales bacterium]|nr:hypothetical protein [Burkholderiales bacterium]